MCMKRKYFLVLFGNDWINHVLSQVFSRVASNIHVEKLMGQVVFLTSHVLQDDIFDTCCSDSEDGKQSLKNLI